MAEHHVAGEAEPRSYWLIYFEDQDVRPEIYTDEAAARHRYTQLKEWSGYSCHLFAPAEALTRLVRERDEHLQARVDAETTAAQQAITHARTTQAMIESSSRLLDRAESAESALATAEREKDEANRAAEARSNLLANIADTCRIRGFDASRHIDERVIALAQAHDAAIQCGLAAESALSAKEEELRGCERDKERMDWLEQKDVAVYALRRYGTGPLQFRVSPDLEEVASDLRRHIDALTAAQQKETKDG